METRRVLDTWMARLEDDSGQGDPESVALVLDDEPSDGMLVGLEEIENGRRKTDYNAAIGPFPFPIPKKDDPPVCKPGKQQTPAQGTDTPAAKPTEEAQSTAEDDKQKGRARVQRQRQKGLRKGRLF